MDSETLGRLKTHVETLELSSWSTLVEEYTYDISKRVSIVPPRINFVVKKWDPESDDISESLILAEKSAYERISLYKHDSASALFAEFFGYKGSLNCKYITIEDIGDRSLTEYLIDSDLENWLKILYQLAHAVEFLERHSINHRDLHPKNIHVDNGNIKIFDFGLSLGKRDDISSS